jgi:hypothetical protein
VHSVGLLYPTNFHSALLTTVVRDNATNPSVRTLTQEKSIFLTDFYIKLYAIK